MPALSNIAVSGVQLDATREISSIPKSGTSDDAEKWVYPSHQQFYNALHRKGYETDERDIPQIVAIHNGINELSWKVKVSNKKSFHFSPFQLLRRFLILNIKEGHREHVLRD